MTEALLERSDPSTATRDGVPLDLLGRWVFWLIVVYLVMNRIIPDLMVLPVGFSLRPYEAVLGILVVAWAVWILRDPLPFPLGLVGAVGLGLVTVLTLAPFINGPGLTPFQANGAERGLFRIFIFAGLFLAAYHQAYRLQYATRLLGWVVAATVIQGLLGIWEFLNATPVTFMFDFARSLGLIFDPNAIRTELTDVFVRDFGGQLRATATAPHPIVLSSVIALAAMIAGIWLVYTRSRRAAFLLIPAAAILVVALPTPNSRTAFVILGASAFPLIVLMIDRLPKLIVWSLAVFLALGVAFAVSPQTPRLLLDSVTNASEDPNTQIRLERFERVPELLAERPVIGAGYLTHDVEIQIFDNAYNLGLIEFGIVGFALAVWWLLCVLVRCWAATRHAADRERILTVSAVAAVLALMASSLTFDAWTFDQFFPTCLIVMAIGTARADIAIRRARRGEHTTVAA